MVRTLTYSTDPVWELVRREAEFGAGNEPQLASSLYATVLNHRRLEDTLAFHLANELASPFFQATQYVKLFRDALYREKAYREAIRADLLAVVRRDPAMKHCVAVLMYNKGYAALQAYRLAHWLWQQDRRVLALFLQSEISKCFAVDIHPAARIGSGVMIDHATGIVIGETAVVGDDVSMLHNVTLGGTGKEAGDRHPKVGRGVLLGAGATVLGNIRIGDGAQITASSVVLKDVAPYAVVSGVPAREVGKLSYPKGVYPAFEMDQRAATAARVRADGRHRRSTEEPASTPDLYLGDSI
jgi:serine O-acetyltransferase